METQVTLNDVVLMNRPGRRRDAVSLFCSACTMMAGGIGISSLNKWIFSSCRYPYPLFLSSLHMLSAALVNFSLLRAGFVCVGPQKKDEDLPPRVRRQIFGLSVTFCASIAFGNMGLNYVQLSFAQTVYATTPLVTMVMSQLLLGQEQGWVRYASMIPVCLGACFSVMGEYEIHKLGCIFVCAATLLRGIKSVQQSVLLQQLQMDSIVLLYAMAVPSFFMLLSATVLFESRALWELLTQKDGRLYLFLTLSCSCAVLYNLASFYVIQLTSAVTVHVLGNLTAIGNVLISQRMQTVTVRLL
ncbi:solute carrier family 35 member E4-like isoform X2 [Protopterus annectens]|uniref:solute carrier family 35 member E4-like isoform X2 n=1 Tax=Protopterus annectens TaxID=7888 RepID=UPI001CF96F8A|nr:solute carrier family 35 member E4-like isoform X2 [Protopterus annectens]